MQTWKGQTQDNLPTTKKKSACLHDTAMTFQCKSKQTEVSWVNGTTRSQLDTSAPLAGHFADSSFKA